MNPQQPGGPWPAPDQNPQTPTPSPQPGMPSPAQPQAYPPQTPGQPGGGVPQPIAPVPTPQTQYPAPAIRPEQQYANPTAAHGNYDFIMNPQQAQKKAPRLSSISTTGSSKTMRIALVAGTVLILIILFAVASSILNRPKPSTVALISVAQEQSEIIRVANLAVSNAKEGSTLDSATTTALTVSSAQQALLSYLGKNNVKVSPKQLLLKQDSTTDTRLTSATDSSTYDKTYLSIMGKLLTTYQKDLKSGYTANPGPSGRTLLSAQYAGVGLLLEQIQTD